MRSNYKIEIKSGEIIDKKYFQTKIAGLAEFDFLIEYSKYPNLVFNIPEASIRLCERRNGKWHVLKQHD
jgi:hypothetical protein